MQDKNIIWFVLVVFLFQILGSGKLTNLHLALLN